MQEIERMQNTKRMTLKNSLSYIKGDPGGVSKK